MEKQIMDEQVLAGLRNSFVQGQEKHGSGCTPHLRYDREKSCSFDDARLGKGTDVYYCFTVVSSGVEYGTLHIYDDNTAELSLFHKTIKTENVFEALEKIYE